jgi:stearoyl-CoA desaturase (delta-9 desaturase)
MSFSKVSSIDVARVTTSQEKLDLLKKQVIWKNEHELPIWSLQEFEKESRYNELVLIEQYAVDVSHFKSQHPGGAKLITNYIGKDATKSFYGVLNNHTQSARQIMKDLRVAKIRAP